MIPSQKCFDLAASFEGCKLLAFDDARPDHILAADDDILGTLTIGRGHTGSDVHIGLTWTQVQADENFARDLQAHCDQMAALVHVPITQGQIDALTDFVYNEGAGTLQRSTLLARLNAGNLAAVPDELCRLDSDNNWHGYVFFRGKVSSDLVRRRQAEIVLWNS